MSDNFNNTVANAAVAPLVLGFSAVVYIFLGLFALIGFSAWNKRKAREFESQYGRSLDRDYQSVDDGYYEEEEARPAPARRLFNARPEPQWLLTFEYWLYRLEMVTGYETTTTPTRYLLSSLFISLAPAVVIGLPSSIVLPHTNGLPLIGLAGAGLVIGVLTAMQLSNPADWFKKREDIPSPSQRGSTINDDPDYIDIGEDVGRYW